MICPNLGVLRTVMWHRYKQGVAFGNKEPGSSANCRVDLSRSVILVWLGLLDNVDLTRAANGIDAMTFVVVENFIRVAGHVDLGDDVAGIRIQHDEL